MRASELIDRCNREGFTAEVLGTIQDFAQDEQQLVESKVSVGSYLHEHGYLEMAQLLFEQALAKEPTDEVRILLADIYFEASREDDAIVLLDEVAPKTQGFIDATILLAEIYASQGFYDVAVHKLAQLETDYLEHDEVQLLIGETYFAYGFFEEALIAFEQVNVEAYEQATIDVPQRLATCWYEVSEYEKALPYFEMIMQAQTQTPADEYAYARTLVQIEREQQAKEVLQALIEADPANTQAVALLVELLLEADEEEQALVQIEQGLKYNEFADQLRLQQALLLKKRGQLAEAEGLLKKLIMQYPNTFTIVKHLLELYLAQERFSELLIIIGELEAMGEFDPILEWYKALAYNGEEEFEQARYQFEQAAYFLSDQLDFLVDYAKFLREEGDRKNLAIIIQRGLALDETDEFFIELAQEYEISTMEDFE
ncbi:MAG: tetratricopeptide repeat protein [Culicoidibacterales bacterium]